MNYGNLQTLYRRAIAGTIGRVRKLKNPAKCLQKQGIFIAFFVATFLFTVAIAPPATAQFNQSNSTVNPVTEWVRLDGHPVLEIAAPKVSISKRLERIENKLQKIRNDYLDAASATPEILVMEQENTKLPEIYVNGTYLLTVTQQDANLLGTTPWALVKQFQEELPQALDRSRLERQQEYWMGQAWIAAGIIVGAIALSFVLFRIGQKIDVPQFAANVISHHPITHKLNREQKDNLQKVEKHLIAIAQIAIWVSAIVIILGLFPYTRPFQVSVLSALEIPLIIAVVIVVSYVGTRLSYIAINRVISSFAESQIIKAQDSRRLELRVSTISSLLKSTALFTWIAIGSIVALSLVGVSLGALIAGAGVIGLLITLGSQNLIKGAINSFFFVLEDQFAVGDVIVVENMNQLGGVVEDMNLRITQLRDAKGRLVTLPNSEIKSVVNFSYEWARSDLKIPVPYNTDINQVIDVINTVAQEMNEDPDWKEDILEEPTLLGIDDFSDRGLLVRLWIKVKPMKQWDVSREYRRRLKLALDSENLHIGLHQEEIWVNPNLPMQVSMNDDNNTVNEPGNEDGNQAVKTGHQGNVDNARERDDSEGEEKY